MLTAQLTALLYQELEGTSLNELLTLTFGLPASLYNIVINWALVQMLVGLNTVSLLTTPVL